MFSTPVDIVMATFDGARHLPEQLRSLQAQTHARWRLLVRDDGSGDQTREVLERFAAQDPRIRIVADGAGRLGPSTGFARLLQRSGLADAVLCADQDDVWHPRKIERLLVALEERRRGGLPALLVCSEAVPVDAELRVLASSFGDWAGLRPPTSGWRWLLVQNHVPGCTVLTTRALRRLALPIPPEALMYDWWLALVAAHHRGLVTVPEPLMLYRRHDGVHTNPGDRDLRAYLRRAVTAPGEILAGRTPVGRQAAAFARRFRADLRSPDLWVRKARVTLRKLRARRRRRLAGRWTTPEAEACRQAAQASIRQVPASPELPA